VVYIGLAVNDVPAINDDCRYFLDTQTPSVSYSLLCLGELALEVHAFWAGEVGLEGWGSSGQVKRQLASQMFFEALLVIEENDAGACSVRDGMCLIRYDPGFSLCVSAGTEQRDQR
jgi:hypothetical protein